MELYWARSESAIVQTEKKYGRMLLSISISLLASREDAEECVSDTYIAAWGRMPTDRPSFLGAYLSKIVRAISIDRYRMRHRKKRDAGVELLIDELAECIPDGSDIEAEYENGRLTELLNRFIRGLTEEKRTVFILRYFSSMPVGDIAVRLGIGESKVKTMLHRIRADLREILEKEGLMQ